VPWASQKKTKQFFLSYSPHTLQVSVPDDLLSICYEFTASWRTELMNSAFIGKFYRSHTTFFSFPHSSFLSSYFFTQQLESVAFLSIEGIHGECLVGGAAGMENKWMMMMTTTKLSSASLP
jgi:hypothetical protein